MLGKLNRRDQQLSRAFSAEVHLNLVRSDYWYPKDPYFSLKISYWYFSQDSIENKTQEIDTNKLKTFKDLTFNYDTRQN